MMSTDWSEGLMDRDDDEQVEVPIDIVRRACQRFGIEPPASADGATRLPPGILKKAFHTFQVDEK